MSAQENLYVMPKLPYGYGELAPHMSEQQLAMHHQKHHQAYVNAANAILERLQNARKEGTDLDMKAVLKDLSFQIGGHILHSLFWENLAPPGKGGGGRPEGHLLQALEKEFGTFERFRKEFTQASASVEGSGWATLVFCKKTQRPLLMQIEKHNTGIYPGFKILFVLDVFEHAYYLDYRNERAKFIEAFWNLANWGEVSKRLEEAAKK